MRDHGNFVRTVAILAFLLTTLCYGPAEGQRDGLLAGQRHPRGVVPPRNASSLDSISPYHLRPFDHRTGLCCNGLDGAIWGLAPKVRETRQNRQPQKARSQACSETRIEDQRVKVGGILQDKRNGAGLAGVTVHFVGAPRDSTITAADGRFVTTTHRARLGQCGLIYNAERRSEQRRISFSVPIDIDEELVGQLEIHTLPDNLLKPVKVRGPRRTYRRLEWNDQRPGILCDGVDCALCGTHTAEEQTSQTTYESDLWAFFNEIDKTYPFFDLKGIGEVWTKVKPSLLERVRQCESDEDFLSIVIDAIRVLRDAHITIVKTQVSIPRPAPRYHPGVSLLPATDGRIVVMHAPKDMAGKLTTGTVVTKIDGIDAKRYLEKRGEIAWNEGGIYFVSSPQRARLFEYRLALCGEKGDEHKITYLQGHQEQSLTVECRFPARGWPHTYNLPAHLNRVGRSFFYTQLADGAGYMYLRRVDSSIPEGIDEALETYPNAKGWIVDMRGNGGGGYDRNLIEKIKRFPRPVAVLIDAGCSSAGETLARDFRALANARLFGSQSAGSSSSKRVWSLPSGIASIRIPVRSRWRGDRKPIEFNGIEPDVQVEAVPEELKAGRNSAILRAQEYIAQETRKQTPAEQDGPPPRAVAIPPRR